MNVLISSITPVFTPVGTLELQSMICSVSGGNYPDNVNATVSLAKADGITLTSTKSEVEEAAVAKFKANVEVLLAPKPQADQQPAK